jgi:hypothetical protein
MSFSNSVHIEERSENGQRHWYLHHTYLQTDFLAQFPPKGPYENREGAEAASARTQQIIEIELFYPTEGHYPDERRP